MMNRGQKGGQWPVAERSSLAHLTNPFPGWLRLCSGARSRAGQGIGVENTRDLEESQGWTALQGRASN